MSNADGSYLFTGDLMAIELGKMNNVSEKGRAKKRIVALAQLKDQDLVVYPAKGEEKGAVVAFTDTSCGYCQKFHREISKLNELGITVKYAAWPRSGLSSQTGKLMADIWCSNDREGAMTLAKTRRPVSASVAGCDSSAVINSQIALGRRIGVNGTPAIFTMDGRQVGGYRSATELAGEFGI